MRVVITGASRGIGRATAQKLAAAGARALTLCDVAYLDDDGVVIKTMQMHRNRVGVPVWRGDLVIEAEAGAFARWGLRVGDVIDVREDDT